LPDIPAIGDFIPGFEASAWAAIGMPKNTPAEIVDKLYKENNACLSDPTIKARLADLVQCFRGSPPDFARFISDETGEVGPG
jgi:tripartite-type tricarboxylate transporter receptor subunit TctC